MSYILDALKKAERERDIRQVPTLMAEHEPAAKDRKRFWLSIGTFVISVAAVVWLVLFLQRTMNTPAPRFTAENGRRDAAEMNARDGEPSTPSAESGVKTATQGEVPAGSTPTAPHAIVPVAPRDFPASASMDGARLRQMARLPAAETQRKDADSQNSPSREMMAAPPARTSTPATAAKAEAPAARASKEKNESLKEALKTMTLSILLYDENKADRMVFINGRKYVEGDYVEDMYLLESITLDGAYLIYGGERALLRPKAR